METSLGKVSNWQPQVYDIHESGEIAVNPADGSILRLTEMRQSMVDLLGWGAVKRKNGTLVKYGPVEIGGMIYICPERSVALEIGPILTSLSQRALQKSSNQSFGLSEDPVAEYLNDVTFEQYHLFRAEMRILPGDTPVCRTRLRLFRRHLLSADWRSERINKP